MWQAIWRRASARLSFSSTNCSQHGRNNATSAVVVATAGSLAAIAFGAAALPIDGGVTRLERNETDDSNNDNEFDWRKVTSEFWSRVQQESGDSSDSKATNKDAHDPAKPEEPSSLLDSFFSSLGADNDENENKSNTTRESSTNHGEKSSSFGVPEFLDILTGRKKPDDYIQDLVTQAQQQASSNDEKMLAESNSFPALVDMFTKYEDQLAKVADRYLHGDQVDWADPPPPAALLYYLEYEDEVKNPSWKRRMHRYFSSINVEQFHELHHALRLAELCYADSVDEIAQGLEETNWAASKNLQEPYQLVYAQVHSAPGKPAHFLAIPKNISMLRPWEPLRVIVGVRGTKTVADALTDLLCDQVNYRGGQAHSFMVESGQHIANQHIPLLRELLRKTNKHHLQVTLVGHSLGAGAASIVGMEWQNSKDLSIDIQVVGFGCPALVSRDLAEECKPYILTVVNDWDVVPRLSGISLANALSRIRRFNWLPYAQRDVHHAIDELLGKQYALLAPETIAKLKERLDPLLSDFYESTSSKNDTKDESGGNNETSSIPPVLFPPGRCVHLYRDGGSGVSTSFVPNDFFHEIDVTRTMIDDHLFHSGYEKMFLELLRYHTENHHFRFDDKTEESA